MKIARRIALVVVVPALLVPLAATSASAGPREVVVDAYCSAQEKLGYQNVQDCRYLIQ